MMRQHARPNTERVAVIGLGSMGLPMAMSLIKAGFQVHGADLSADARDALSQAGGTAHTTPAEAAANADIILVMVVNAAQADDVLFGSAGSVHTQPSGSVVILSTTMAPVAAQAIGKKLHEHDILMLDAPVTGGVRGAQAATLIILAAGPEQAYAKAQPVLSALGRQIFRVGDQHGQGATAKIINQLLCGVHLAAAAEAVALAERSGIPRGAFYDFITAGSATSHMFEDRAPLMWQPKPAVKSALDLFVKDLGLVADLGRSMNHPTYIADIALQVFVAASKAGLGQHNDSDVIEVYRKDLAVTNPAAAK